MKNLAQLLFALIALIAFSSCARSEPEKALRAYLDNVWSGNITAAESLLTEEAREPRLVRGEEYSSMAAATVRCTPYQSKPEVMMVEISGDTALITTRSKIIRKTGGVDVGTIQMYTFELHEEGDRWLVHSVKLE